VPGQLLGCMAASLDAICEATAATAAGSGAGGDSGGGAELAPDRRVTLAAQRGDVAAMLRAAVGAGGITPDVALLATGGGRRAAAAAARLCAVREEGLGQVHAAALQLLAAGDPAGAGEVYRQAGLMQEAAWLAEQQQTQQHPA